MKIINDEYTRYPRYLYQIDAGEVVEFENGFHQKHALDAKFLVLRVPGEYIDEKKRNKGGEFRIMVANIETGAVSLVTNGRRVRVFDAEVVLK